MGLFDTVQTEFVQLLKNSGHEVEVVDVGDTEENWYLEVKVGDRIFKLEDITDDKDLISVQDQVDILDEMMYNSCKGNCQCSKPDLKTYILQNRKATRY